MAKPAAMALRQLAKRLLHWSRLATIQRSLFSGFLTRAALSTRFLLQASDFLQGFRRIGFTVNQ